MAYTDKAAALAALKGLPAVRNLPDVADDDYLDSLLNASAGRVPAAGAIEGDQTYSAGTLVYRHFYVAARYLETARSQHILSKAGDKQFTGLAVPIASLMSQQNAMDTALALEVPAGYEAIATQPSENSAAPSVGILLGSRSTGTSLKP